MENKYNKNPIKNADTRARREWIASALESVRAHLDVSTFQTSTLESQGHERYEPGARPDAKPSLYLAWSNGQRRSGT
jgi:hypothetical protein